MNYPQADHTILFRGRKRRGQSAGKSRLRKAEFRIDMHHTGFWLADRGRQIAADAATLQLHAIAFQIIEATYTVAYAFRLRHSARNTSRNRVICPMFDQGGFGRVFNFIS